MLRQVTPGRYDAYEALLRALATPSSGQVWMLLWHGQAGSPDAQYGNMEVEGYGYAPVRHLRPGAVGQRLEPRRTRWSTASTWPAPSTRTTSASGSTRTPPAAASASPGSTCAASPPAWTASPPARCACPNPAIEIPQFYALLAQNAHRTPAVRSLRRAWVQPALGAPYLAIGLDVYDTSPPAVDSVRAMMQQSIGAVPDGPAGLHGRDVRRARPGRHVDARQRPPVLRPRGARRGPRPGAGGRLRLPPAQGRY